MKILLTSQGLYNDTISKALFDLLEKPASETSVAFVPTAATAVDYNKDWLIDDLYNVRKQNFKYIDIVDISAVPESNWMPRLQKADVIFFGGGNPFHLMEWADKLNLRNIFPDLLKGKVYIGSSSGAIMMGLTVPLKAKIFYESSTEQTANMEGLGFVDFTFIPHYLTSDFPQVNEKTVLELAKELNQTIYTTDDETAIKIDDDKLEIVGKGKWEKFN